MDKLTRKDIRPYSYGDYREYEAQDGMETIRVRLAETTSGWMAVRAYVRDSGTEIFIGPFATQEEAQSVADGLVWQGYAE